MFAQTALFLVGLTSWGMAEEASVLDHGDSGSGGYSMNTISADYSEFSVIEEIPMDLANINDKSEVQKVKVHKSFHKKHKGLPLEVQPREDSKIEDIEAKKKDGLHSRDQRGNSVTQIDILAAFQDTAAYKWWHEVAVRN